MAGEFSAGFSNGVQLAQAMENAQRQREELEIKKQEHQIKVSNYLLNKLNKTALLPDKIRKVAVKNLIAESEALKMPLNPETVEVSMDPQYRTQTLQSLAALSMLPQDAKGQAMISAVAGFSGDPEHFIDNVQKFSSEYARLLTSRRGAQPTGTDILANTEKAIGVAKQQFAEEFNVIKQVNNLNTLAADGKRRKQAFPADAAQVILAKLLDPATGVREGEVERVSGLGTGALSVVQNSLARAAKGQVLNDQQWKQILAVSNLIGQKSSERVENFKMRLTPTLAKASVDPEVAFAGIPSLEGFDFEKSFGKGSSPVGLNSTKKKKTTDFADVPPELGEKFARAGLEPGSPKFNQALEAFLAQQKKQTAEAPTETVTDVDLASPPSKGAPPFPATPSPGGSPAPLEIEEIVEEK